MYIYEQFKALLNSMNNHTDGWSFKKVIMAWTMILVTKLILNVVEDVYIYYSIILLLLFILLLLGLIKMKEIVELKNGFTKEISTKTETTQTETTTHKADETIQ